MSVLSIPSLSTLRPAARGPFGAGQNHHGGDEAPQHDGDGMFEDEVLVLELRLGIRRDGEVHVFEGFEDESDENGRGSHARRRDLAVAVSYTHLTLPTILRVEISVVG